MFSAGSHPMQRSGAARSAVVVAVWAAVGASACSGSDSGAATTIVTTSAPPATTSAPFTPIESEPVRVFADGPLADVCPSPLVVQLDSLPTIRTGPLFELLAPGAVVDEVGQRITSAIRRPDGTVDDVELELRAGGPAVAFRSALATLRDDAGVHLAEAPFSQLALATESSAFAVVALAASNDDMIMWDPATHPGIDDLDAVRTSGIEIVHLDGEAFIEFLAANGVVDPEQLRPGAESGVARFITADGDVARQGDAIIDPQLFPTIPQWGRPIASALASTRGWLDVDHLLATDDGRVDDECLGRLVPIIQAAIAAYVDDPSAANEVMAAARSQFNPLTRVSAAVFDAAASDAADDDLLDTAFDGIVGGFDPERLEAFTPALAAALRAETRPLDDVVTDRFLDPTLVADPPS